MMQQLVRDIEWNGCSNNIRSVTAGYDGSTGGNIMDYVTISTLGDAVDFGDLDYNCNQAAFASSTRGIFAGGDSSPQIDFITIATTGDALDFVGTVLEQLLQTNVVMQQEESSK